jgi:hypothetical protein
MVEPNFRERCESILWIIRLPRLAAATGRLVTGGRRLQADGIRRLAPPFSALGHCASTGVGIPFRSDFAWDCNRGRGNRRPLGGAPSDRAWREVPRALRARRDRGRSVRDSARRRSPSVRDRGQLRDSMVIADGDEKPGEGLPPARDLAAVLGVTTNRPRGGHRRTREEQRSVFGAASRPIAAKRPVGIVRQF